jgi:hypothetical protein
MAPHSSPDRLLFNERFSAVVSGGLLVLMMICAAMVAAQAAQRLTPGWRGDYVAAGAALVALEGVISVRVVQRLGLSFWSGAFYRLVELILILAALKLFFYSRIGWEHLPADLPRWQNDWATFFEGEYPFACLLLGGIWLLSWIMAGTLLELEGDVVLLDREARIESNRTGTRRSLAAQIFGVGAGMVILTTLGHSDLSRLGLYLPAVAPGLFNVVEYFFLGLMLYSLAHFAVLRAIWSLERIDIGQNIAARWVIYTLAMLLGVALLAGVLPTRYSLGLLSTLAYILSVVVTVLYGAVALVLALLAMLTGWLSHLFGVSAPKLPPPAPPTPVAPPPVVPAAVPVPWLEALKSVLFWGVFLAILGYSIYYYANRQKQVALFLRRLPLWRWVVRGWRAVWGGVQALNQQLAAAVQQGLRRLRPAGVSAPWGYLGLRRLSPAERVRFFYLALVRRSGESGLPRRASQTPYEYESDLNASIPEAGDDVATLTEAFVEARYSRHPITAAAAEAVRLHWEQLRKQLRPRQRRP